MICGESFVKSRSGLVANWDQLSHNFPGSLNFPAWNHVAWLTQQVASRDLVGSLSPSSRSCRRASCSTNSRGPQLHRISQLHTQAPSRIFIPLHLRNVGSNRLYSHCRYPRCTNIHIILKANEPRSQQCTGGCVGSRTRRLGPALNSGQSVLLFRTQQGFTTGPLEGRRPTSCVPDTSPRACSQIRSTAARQVQGAVGA